MTCDALSEVVDELLNVAVRDVQELKRLRESEKFLNLSGVNTAAEQARLSQVFNELLERLILQIQEKPNKLWVLSQFQIALEAVQMEDTEARENFGEWLEQVMDVLHIESSDGLLNFYL